MIGPLLWILAVVALHVEGRRRLAWAARADHDVRGPLCTARLALGGLEPSARVQAIDLELRRAAQALDDRAAARRGRRAGGGRSAVDLGGLLAAAAPAWDALARAHGTLLTVGGGGPARVHGEPLRLAHACANLVANAVEHGGERVDVRVTAGDGRAGVHVSDDGDGLPAPLPTLLAAARGRSATRGHGLAIAAGIARRHGGRLVELPSATGAHLVLDLPAAAPPTCRDEPGLVSRRRRAALLLGLALVLGALAASDMGRREAALRAQMGPMVAVVTAARALPAGRRLDTGDLAVRRMPERFAAGGVAALPELLVGRRLAVAVPADAAVAEHLLAEDGAPGAAVGRGQRAAEIVAAASPELVVPGARVDVLVTRERGAVGETELALEDVEVLAARAAAAATREDSQPRVAATLRVSAAQAVYLAAAGVFARDIRLLARSPGDRARLGRAVVGSELAPPSGR